MWKTKNICNIFISSYILTAWKTRKENLRIGILKSMIINKCLGTIDTMEHMPKIAVGTILGNYTTKLEQLIPWNI